MIPEHCHQCGREGERGFRLVGERGPEQERGISWFVVCSNNQSCRKRWPRQSAKDDE